MSGLVSDSYSPIRDPAAFVAAGYEGCMRYLSLTPAKNLTKSEAEACWAAGLLVGLNWETSADAWQGGGETGARAGHTANLQADALGFPPATPIYYTPVDQSVSVAAAWPLVADYLARAAAEGPRPVGLYWGSPMIDRAMREGLATYGWIAGAYSWSFPKSKPPRWDPPADTGDAHLLQRPGELSVSGTAIDRNDVLRREWGGYNPSQTVHQEDDDMPAPRQFLAEDPETHEVGLFTEWKDERVWVDHTEDVQGLIAVGVPWIGQNKTFFRITSRKEGVGDLYHRQPAVVAPPG